MLYIASALTPTPILDTLRLSGFTGPSSSSLIVAKPDKVEVWDVTPSGLEWRAELSLWGSIISIAQAQIEDAPPHILVLTAPPSARILLLSYQSSPKPELVVTGSLSLIPPTPSLRQAEFCSKVLSQGNVALVSLWTGVLSCIELEVEKDKDAKKRRSSTVETQSSEGKRIVFRDSFNINIREHNLLDIAFLQPKNLTATPNVAFLWQSSSGALLLQYREVSLVAHAFNDTSLSVNVLCPTNDNMDLHEPDFGDIAYSCPAARYILPINPDQLLLMGDEYVVFYGINATPKSPRVSRASFSSASGIATSPRASATRRSPQNEMSAPGKRRKGSNASRRLSSATDKGELKPIFRSRQGFGAILSYTVLSAHESGGSVVIGDECGHLTAYGWEIEQTSYQRGTVNVSKVDLGTCSPPSSLTYLDSSHLFVASIYGDSQLVELQLSPNAPSVVSPSGKASPVIRKGKGRASISEGDGGDWNVHATDERGSFVGRERWMNLAPLRDFCVVEDEAGGVSHLVTASGASTSNSLRVIRSGVGLEDVLALQGISDVQGLFPFGNIEDPSGNLLISTSTNSHMVSMGDEAEIVPLDPSLANHPTIAASMINAMTLAHVSPRAVTICSLDISVVPVDSWRVAVDEEIVASSISGRFVAVAKRGGEVVVISANDDGFDIVTAQRVPGEVAAIAILADETIPSPIIAISTWTNDILLYTLDHLQTVDPLITPIHEGHHAVSLMLRPSKGSSTTSGVQLFAGLSDGTMAIFDVEQSDQGGGVTAVGRKASSLGARPLKLVGIEEFSHGDDIIIALGLTERLSIIFENKGRVDFSTVSRKDVTAVTAQNIGDDCLVLATPSGLTFSRVTSLKKLSIQTLGLGNASPTKLLSLSEPKLLAVGITERHMDREDGDVNQRSRFELRDPSSLEILVKMPLEVREEVSCISEVLLLGKKYVAVGTAIVAEDEGDEFTHGNTINAKAGRIHLIEPRKTGDAWQMTVKTTFETIGPVHDVKVIHGFLAVAAGSKVSIHRLDTSPFGLKEVSNFASMFIAQHLYVTPVSKLHAEERLVVGDGMRSIFVLEVDDGSGMIYADQRDLATHQVMALEGIQDGGQGVIIADGYSNILTLRLGENIESAASFGLHEDVARFRPGSLVPPSSAPEIMNPELLFATTDGRLGILGELTKGATKTLSDLQRNMDKYHQGPGGVEWKSWRRGGTELIKKETAGFVDGDFVQRFLDLEVDQQKTLYEGTNPHEKVGKLAPDGRAVLAEKSDVVGMLQAVAGLH